MATGILLGHSATLLPGTPLLLIGEYEPSFDLHRHAHKLQCSSIHVGGKNRYNDPNAQEFANVTGDLGI